jgi:hypothetical protein
MGQYSVAKKNRESAQINILRSAHSASVGAGVSTVLLQRVNEESATTENWLSAAPIGATAYPHCPILPQYGFILPHGTQKCNPNFWFYVNLQQEIEN